MHMTRLDIYNFVYINLKYNENHTNIDLVVNDLDLMAIGHSQVIDFWLNVNPNMLPFK